MVLFKLNVKVNTDNVDAIISPKEMVWYFKLKCASCLENTENEIFF